MNVNATQNTFELDTGAQCYIIPFSLDNEISNKPVITKGIKLILLQNAL